MRFLRFDCHCRDRPGNQPLQTDRIAGHLAIAVFALINPPQRRINLRDKLALAITRAQFDAPVSLARGAVIEVGFAYRPVLQRLKRLVGG